MVTHGAPLPLQMAPGLAFAILEQRHWRDKKPVVITAGSRRFTLAAKAVVMQLRVKLLGSFLKQAGAFLLVGHAAVLLVAL